MIRAFFYSRNSIFNNQILVKHIFFISAVPPYFPYQPILRRENMWELGLNLWSLSLQMPALATRPWYLGLRRANAMKLKLVLPSSKLGKHKKDPKPKKQARKYLVHFLSFSRILFQPFFFFFTRRVLDWVVSQILNFLSFSKFKPLLSFLAKNLFFKSQ